MLGIMVRNMKLFPILLFSMLIAVPCLGGTLKDPFTLAFEEFKEKGYLAPVEKLKSLESEYLASDQKDVFLQAVATYYSYLGEYSLAIKYFDQMQANETADLNIGSFDPSRYKVESAPRVISELSKNHRAVFINEAHHVPQHRALTVRLLKALYKQGFRYFAAETLSHEDESALGRRGFPIVSTGFYTVEPVHADLVREALNIGYKVVAYEFANSSCDYVRTPDLCQNEREENQAKNLVQKIFRIDQNAKVFVHAGYGHIDETGGSQSFPWIPMARYFKDLTGIDPLTIDQVDMTEHSAKQFEKAEYTEVMKHFNPSDTVVLRASETGVFWTGMPGHYDLQVFSPRSNSPGRPAWLRQIPSRRPYAVSSDMCSKMPCLVQAYRADEAHVGESIPFDQIVFWTEGEKELLLKSGDYVLRINQQPHSIIHVK